MKIGKWAWLMLTAAPFLAGCKGFWNAPATTTTTTTTLSSGVFYVLNQTTSQIAADSVVSGVLTAVNSNSPYSVPTGPYAIAVAPNGKFLYLSTVSGIYLYTIGTDGALTEVGTTAVYDDATAISLAVDSTSSWLLDASTPNLSANVLYAIPINPSTGAITLKSGATPSSVTLPGAAASIVQVVISPDNTKVFVAEGANGTEWAPFTASNSNPLGNAANIRVYASGGEANAVAVDPITASVTASRLFYIGETAAVGTTGNTGGLRIFNYSTMKELPKADSPVSSGGLAPTFILPAATGDYVFVANKTVSGGSTGNVVTFAVTSSGTTYSLTAQTTTASAGTDPVGLAEDSEGNFLLAVSSGGGPDLDAYIFDTTTAGKLDSAITSTTGTDPVGAIQVVALPAQ
jgi:6-phosphogluconolactonase (cycloisomerase 2 family)